MARLSRAHTIPASDTARRSSITFASLLAWAGCADVGLEQRVARAGAAHALLKNSVCNRHGELVVTSVRLRSFRHLDALPDGLTVAGRMSMSGVGLHRLPRALDVGQLDITGARHLAGAGEGLRVRGTAYFCRCAHLSTLPADAKVDGDLFGFDCESFTLGASAANFGGNIYMWRTPIPVHLQDVARDFRGRLAWRPHRFPFPFTAQQMYLDHRVVGDFLEDSRHFGFVARASQAGTQPKKTSAPALPGRDALPLRHLSSQIIAGVECPFLLEPLHDLPDGVFWRVGDVVHGASYTQLCRWWSREQTDPSTRTALTAQDLFRAA